MEKKIYFILLAVSFLFGQNSSRAQVKLGEPSYAKAEQAKIAYWEIGAGDPILLVHGFLGRATSWSNYIDEMSKKNKLILVDLRDHGFSTNEKKSYTNIDAASDLIAVLDDIGIDSVDAVGFSAGAMAVLNMAVSFPGRLKSMALIGGFIQTSDNSVKLFQSFHPDSLDQSMIDGIASNHERGELQAKKLLGHLQEFSKETDRQFSNTQLTSIKAPTLIITGDRDLAIPFDQSVELYQSIPNSYFMVFPNTGHSMSPADGNGHDYLISTLLGFFSNTWKCPAFCDESIKSN
jgi:pimeloyl-ACP methyl ester carboxylesterase